MEKRKPIKVLAAEVIEKLKQLNYSPNSIRGFRSSFKRICAFAQDRDELYFSEAFGKQYLRGNRDSYINFYKVAQFYFEIASSGPISLAVITAELHCAESDSSSPIISGRCDDFHSRISA